MFIFLSVYWRMVCFFVYLFVRIRGSCMKLYSRRQLILSAVVAGCFIALAESGFVTKSMHPNGKAYFQIASQQGTEHHHRIVCSKCKASADIAVCPLHDLENQILSETGFTMTSHSIELTGLCPTCKAEEEAQASQTKAP